MRLLPNQQLPHGSALRTRSAPKPYCRAASAPCYGAQLRAARHAAPQLASRQQKLCQRGRQPGRLVVRASTLEPGSTARLPVFPLGVVAMPSANCPLRIFEARYRVLFNTLLAGSEGLEEGLVNWDSPFSGTRRFGMNFVDQRGGLAATGCVLEITGFKRMEDGQMLINTKGTQRYRIKDVVEERPVLVCDVEVLAEDEDLGPTATALAGDVSSLLRDTLKLRVKMQKQAVDEALLNPTELDELGPRELSYWITTLFADSPMQQQLLLEEDSTTMRLQRVREILDGTLKYLRATSALESAFSPSSPSTPPTGSEGSGGPAPPAGGPD